MHNDILAKTKKHFHSEHEHGTTCAHNHHNDHGVNKKMKKYNENNSVEMKVLEPQADQKNNLKGHHSHDDHEHGSSC